MGSKKRDFRYSSLATPLKEGGLTLSIILSLGDGTTGQAAYDTGAAVGNG